MSSVCNERMQHLAHAVCLTCCLVVFIKCSYINFVNDPIHILSLKGFFLNPELSGICINVRVTSRKRVAF